MGDRIGRLDRGREGVQRDEVGRVFLQAGEMAASLECLRPSVRGSIAIPFIEHEPDGRRRMGGCRGRRRGALAPDPGARDGSSPEA
jgi:hypothetical protein